MGGLGQHRGTGRIPPGTPSQKKKVRAVVEMRSRFKLDLCHTCCQKPCTCPPNENN